MEVIGTGTVLYSGDVGLRSGTTILVPDDPALVGLGSSIAEMHSAEGMTTAVVPKDHLFAMLKRFSSQGMDAAGIVWSADIEEANAEGPNDIDVLGRLDYHDPSSLFGRPTLCLLSRKGVTWGSIPDRPRVTIERRYRNICERYVKGMWKGATISEPPPGTCPGCAGGSDLVIAMVEGADIIERTDLHPIDIVARSDPVLVEIAP